MTHANVACNVARPDFKITTVSTPSAETAGESAQPLQLPDSATSPHLRNVHSLE
jgi:hypothetical protein